MSNNISRLYSNLIYLEDELGIYLSNLSASELAILARAADDLSKLPTEVREDLYDQLEQDLYDDNSVTGGN